MSKSPGETSIFAFAGPFPVNIMPAIAVSGGRNGLGLATAQVSFVQGGHANRFSSFICGIEPHSPGH